MQNSEIISRSNPLSKFDWAGIIFVVSFLPIYNKWDCGLSQLATRDYRIWNAYCLPRVVCIHDAVMSTMSSHNCCVFFFSQQNILIRQFLLEAKNVELSLVSEFLRICHAHTTITKQKLRTANKLVKILVLHSRLQACHCKRIYKNWSRLMCQIWKLLILEYSSSAANMISQYFSALYRMIWLLRSFADTAS